MTRDGGVHARAASRRRRTQPGGRPDGATYPPGMTVSTDLFAMAAPACPECPQSIQRGEQTWDWDERDGWRLHASTVCARGHRVPVQPLDDPRRATVRVAPSPPAGSPATLRGYTRTGRQSWSPAAASAAWPRPTGRRSERRPRPRRGDRAARRPADRPGGSARSRPWAARSARCSRATRPCARRSTGHARRLGGQRPADAPAAEARATRRASRIRESRVNLRARPSGLLRESG